MLLILLVLAGPFARIKPFNMNPVWREYSYLGEWMALRSGVSLPCFLIPAAFADVASCMRACRCSAAHFLSGLLDQGLMGAR